jgi:Flp pilus assembly protein TadB
VSLAGFFVAGTVVILLQFIRVKEWRLLPLLALFACLALAHAQVDWYAARPYHLAAGIAGLVLLFVLSPRHHASH